MVESFYAEQLSLFSRKGGLTAPYRQSARGGSWMQHPFECFDDHSSYAERVKDARAWLSLPENHGKVAYVQVFTLAEIEACFSKDVKPLFIRGVNG